MVGIGDSNHATKFYGGFQSSAAGNMNGYNITGLAAATAGTDALPKGQADTLLCGDQSQPRCQRHHDGPIGQRSASKWGAGNGLDADTVDGQHAAALGLPSGAMVLGLPNDARLDGGRLHRAGSQLGFI